MNAFFSIIGIPLRDQSVDTAQRVPWRKIRSLWPGAGSAADRTIVLRTVC